MSHSVLQRVLPRASLICSSCRSKLFQVRPLSASTSRRKDDFDAAFDQQLAALAKGHSTTSFTPTKPSPSLPLTPQGSLSANLSPDVDALYSIYDNDTGRSRQEDDSLHHLHIYATKHNTHITLTNPKRDALISVSAGNIGARKAQRGTYDAAYQLAAWVMKQIPQKGQDRKWINELKHIELVLRGYGPGREAATKALMASEGRDIRSKIVRVTDATRLKFGGTRSKKPRRLG